MRLTSRLRRCSCPNHRLASHKVVSAHAPETYGLAKSMNSGSVEFPATLYTPLVLPTYTASRLSPLDNARSLYPHSCIPLPPLSRYTSINPLIERGTTPPIKYNIHSDMRGHQTQIYGLEPSARRLPASPSSCSHRGSTMGPLVCEMYFLP
jgi:hypothetical protein